MKARSLILSIAMVVAQAAIVLAGNDTLAVLSSDMAPYEEAYAGFKEAFEQSVELARLSAGPLRFKGQPRIVVAFGGKAAHQKYPDSSVLIYCMAPGTYISLTDHRGESTQISMMPEPEILLTKLKGIQPSLKKLAILWSSPSFEVYAKEVSEVGPRRAIEILGNRLTKPGDLPGRLRDLQGRVDAIWLPPDPLLINSSDLVIITQFALSNHVPLYSSVSGLTEQGAVASISSTFREIGKAAGRAAKRALSGNSLPSELYPEVIMMTINRQSAAKVGLDVQDTLPGETQRSAP